MYRANVERMEAVVANAAAGRSSAAQKSSAIQVGYKTHSGLD